MIHVIPGFLGEQSDFDFIKSEFDILVHDLRTFSTQEIAAKIGPEDYILGYSLGGRVALEVAKLLQLKIKRVLLLASHPGLITDQDKMARQEWEKTVLEKLTRSSDEFFHWWNSLPVFKSDPSLSPRDLSGWNEVFSRYALSQQDNFLLVLRANPEKFLYVFGTQDEKYAAMSREVISQVGVECIGVEAGHRVFLNHQSILKILRKVIL